MNKQEYVEKLERKISKAKVKLSELKERRGEFATQEKEFVDKLERKISKTKGKLGELNERRQDFMEDMQHDEIEQLEAHLRSTEHKLADLKMASVEAWHEIRDSIEERWEGLSDWAKEKFKHD